MQQQFLGVEGACEVVQHDFVLQIKVCELLFDKGGAGRRWPVLLLASGLVEHLWTHFLKLLWWLRSLLFDFGRQGS